jgi:hypothetical protein
MRILKSEVHDLHGDDDRETAEPPRPAQALLPPPQQQIDELQRQIRDLQHQPAGQPATVGGASAADPPQTQRLS